MSVLNVALFGYGYAGKTFHAPLIASVPGLQLAAVVSSDALKVRADWPDVSVGNVHDEVLARANVELVVIATPNNTHFDLARRALRAGKHVVVDKPFTLTLAEARELIALAQQTGRLLSVFHNRRWDADFLTVRGLIEHGVLGEIAHFESHFDRYRPQVQPRWREAPGVGGGLWYDLGPHLVDQALQLFGLPLAVYADFARQREQAQAVDYFHVLLRYPRLRVILHGSALVPGGNPRFLVHGDVASFLKYGLDTQEAALKRGERPGVSSDWGRDEQHGTLLRPVAAGVQTEIIATAPGDYRAYYSGVRDAVVNRGPNPVPAQQAADVMTIIELGRASAAEGREQSLDQTALP